MKLTLAEIKYITLFENLTGAKVKDCIPEGNVLLFEIEEASIPQALKGKHRVAHAIKKDIKLLAYSDNLTTFIKHLIYPIHVEVTHDADSVTIFTQNSADRGKIYGRSRERLEKITALVKRYFPITTINVQ